MELPAKYLNNRRPNLNAALAASQVLQLPRGTIKVKALETSDAYRGCADSFV